MAQLIQSVQNLTPQDQMKFRNMSSSEIERHMYITGHPLYDMMWRRREPFPEKAAVGTDSKNAQSALHSDFLQVKNTIELLSSYVAKGMADRVRLIDEVKKLSAMLDLGVFTMGDIEKEYNVPAQKPFNFDAKS